MSHFTKVLFTLSTAFSLAGYSQSLSEGVVVAVHSAEELGLMAVFEGLTAEAVLQNLEKANPDASLLKTQFQFPNGQNITYDVAAPKHKWVIQSIDGEVANRDFDTWALITDH